MPTQARESSHSPPVRRPRCFTATLGDGRPIEITPVGRGGPAPTAFGEIGRTVARMAALDEADAVRLGISVPAAWLARLAPALGAGELGLAWFTTLVGTPERAAAEVRLARGAARAGLGPMLLDTVVLAATERGVTCLTVRLGDHDDDYAPALGRYRARLSRSEGGVLTAELSLGSRLRRFHWSGLHRRVTGPVEAI